MSVSSQNELIGAEVRKGAARARAQRRSRAGLSWPTCSPSRGVSAATARQAAAEISANPEKALAVHTLEELGIDPSELPSPLVAAGASMASFAVGALIPLLGYLVGVDVLGVALGAGRGRLGSRRRHGLAADRTAVLARGAAAAGPGGLRRRHHLPDRHRDRSHPQVSRLARAGQPGSASCVRAAPGDGSPKRVRLIRRGAAADGAPGCEDLTLGLIVSRRLPRDADFDRPGRRDHHRLVPVCPAGAPRDLPRRRLSQPSPRDATVAIRLSPGLQAYSFTYG